MRIDAITEIGPKRKDNQDSYWVAKIRENSQDGVIACLCDGMGGLDKGALTSQTVVRAVREFISQGNWVLSDLIPMLEELNTSLYHKGKRDGYRAGTTCTLVKLFNYNYDVLHVGDSKCFRVDIETNESIQLTEAHNLYEYWKANDPNRLVGLSNEKLRKTKNTLTRCIGAEEQVRLDRYQGKYVAGDKFVICSDGFWHMVEAGYPVNKITNLHEYVQMCIQQGETDNLTGIIVDDIE